MEVIDIKMPRIKDLTEVPLKSLIINELEKYFAHSGIGDLVNQITLANHLLDSFRQELECAMIDFIFTHHSVKGNQTKAAQILGMSRNTLRKKLSSIYNSE